MRGADGYSARYVGKDPGMKLLHSQSKEMFNAARRIENKWGRHHRTIAAFRSEIYSLYDGVDILWIRGKKYAVHRSDKMRRMADIYLLYATCDARPELINMERLE
jgi:hypothetical protein